MTLLEKVRRFAERRRQILLDRLKSQNEADTKEVKWQGYNSDGHAIVKNDDKTEVVDGQGLTSNRSNKSLILDKAGTVEYKKKAEPPAPRPDKKPIAAASPPVSKKKSSLLTADPTSEFSLAIIRRREEEQLRNFTVEISYSWTTGRDLDTTTQITSPISEGPVGWAHSGSTTHLTWSGDDTSTSGTERVTVNAALFYENNDPEDITVTMRGNWYGEAGTSVSLQARVLLEDGSEKERIFWTAALSLEQQGGTGLPVGSITIKPNATVFRAS